ncbi:MAG TPA: methyltransferase domain-containing protein [Jatrophihabitans sp.]|jgi:S-adenosylmethionine-dependent methyltransferase|nr:methyltransferase domain-containing protein [Jatrophihabitans sp.]
MSGSGNARPQTFDQHATSWREWQASPWGRLRYRLAAHTLDRVLQPLGSGCQVLDVGGGDGADSVRLAEQGHLVTILDHSEPLLARAAAAAAEAGVTGRVRTVLGDVGRLAEPGFLGAAGQPGFDLVLCHNVLHYLSGGGDIVRCLVGTVRIGGLLSLMAPNPAMDVLAAAVRDLDPVAALAVLDAPTVRSVTFEHDMRRLDPRDVEDLLAMCGCRVSDRFGIRCVMDLIADNEKKAAPGFFADLERLELALCDREPYWRTARFWQLVATRTSPSPVEAE